MCRVSYQAIVREMRLFGGSLRRPSPQTDAQNAPRRCAGNRSDGV